MNEEIKERGEPAVNEEIKDDVNNCVSRTVGHHPVVPVGDTNRD
jgi:hypothetical protein